MSSGPRPTLGVPWLEVREPTQLRNLGSRRSAESATNAAEKRGFVRVRLVRLAELRGGLQRRLLQFRRELTLGRGEELVEARGGDRAVGLRQTPNRPCPSLARAAC